MTMSTRGLWNSLLALAKSEEHLEDLLTEVYQVMQQAASDAQRAEDFPVWEEGSTMTAEEYSAKAKEVLTEYGWDAEAEALTLRLLRPEDQFDAQDLAYGEWRWSGNEPNILGLNH